MVVNVCNSSIQAKAGESGVGGQTGLHYETLSQTTSLGKGRCH
jgi:hypothetical protein